MFHVKYLFCRVVPYPFDSAAGGGHTTRHAPLPPPPPVHALACILHVQSIRSQTFPSTSIMQLSIKKYGVFRCEAVSFGRLYARSPFVFLLYRCAQYGR